jgi:hypothetical protein
MIRIHESRERVKDLVGVNTIKAERQSSSRDVGEERHLNELYRKDMRDHKHLSLRAFIAEAVMKQQ